MATNIIPPPQIPGSGPSQDLSQHMAEFNKSIGLGAENNIPPINPNTYDPRPGAINIYQQVVGNPLTGSNPGLKRPALTVSESLTNLNNYSKALADKSDRQVNAATDVTQRMRSFTFNGDSDGANFQRYYNSAPFKQLGFNPYRNNEELYNNHMTTGDEFVRAAGQWPSLIKTGFMSGLEAWGSMFTDPLKADTKNSKAMAKAMAIGSSTKEGTSSFLINTFLNSGYTIGIGAEMLGENLLLGGLISGVSKLDALKDFGTAAKVITEASETAKDFKKADSIPELKNLWTTVKSGLGSAVDAINPLESTFNLGKEIASGENAIKYTNQATGTIKKFAQYSNNFGAFASDLIQIKAAVSEAQIEGGGVQVDVTENLINEYRATHSGVDPQGEELARIENIAKAEAHRTALWNLPAIMWSNKIMYKTLFAPAESLAKKYGVKAVNTAEGLLEKGGVFTVPTEGLAGEVELLAQKAKSPKSWGQFGYDYLKENSAEGIQENLQEAISSGAKAHALATYNNPDRASYEGYMGYFMKGMKEQFSAQGAETFAGGFVMALMAHPIMSAPMFLGENIINNTIKKESYDKYKAERKSQLESLANSLNESFANPQDYLAFDMVNAVKQGNLQEDFYNATVANNRKKAEDIKNISVNEHLYTALQTDKFQPLVDKFKKMADLSPQDAADAFLGEGHTEEEGVKALGMINGVIERADRLKKTFEAVSESYPNPYTPGKFARGSEEHIAHAIGSIAWDEAKKTLIFAKTEFDNHTNRIKQTLDALISKRNPIKDVNTQDLVVLMDRSQMADTLKVLKSDIKNTDSSTAEGRKIIKEKEKRAELLEALHDKFTLLTSPKFRLSELNSKERTAENKNLKKTFKNYINHISGVHGELVFDTELDHALTLIMDNHTLRDERASLVKSINVLNNPKGFLNLQRSLVGTFTDIDDTKVEETARRLERFANIDQQSKANNILFKEAGVYLTPEYSLHFENAMANNLPIELPSMYIDGVNLGVEITDRTSDAFKKAEEVFKKLINTISNESEEKGIRTGTAPSQGLIKKAIRFGFTKEQVNELTTEERAEIGQSNEKSQIQHILDKYSKPKVTPVEARHNVDVANINDRLKHRQAEVDKILEDIEKSGITADKNFPTAELEDGSTFIETQKADDEDFKARLQIHDNIKESDVDVRGGQLVAIQNLRTTGFLDNREAEGAYSMGSASEMITLAVRRIQWMKVKSEEAGDEEAVGKLLDYLDDVFELNRLGTNLKILKDIQGTLVKKSDEGYDEYIIRLRSGVSKFNDDIKAIKNRTTKTNIDRIKLYNAGIETFTNAIEFAKENIKAETVTEKFETPTDEITSLMNRLRDLENQKEEYKLSDQVEEDTPELIIANNWKKIDTTSAQEETGLKASAVGKKAADISTSLVSKTGLTVGKAAEYFAQNFGDTLSMDDPEIRNVIIDILSAGSIDAYKKGIVVSSGIQQINREIKEVSQKLEQLQVEAGLHPKYEFAAMTHNVGSESKKGTYVQYQNLPDDVPTTEYFVYKTKVEGKTKYVTVDKYKLTGFTNSLFHIATGDTVEEAIINGFKTLSGQDKEAGEEPISTQEQLKSINDIKTFDDYDKAYEDVKNAFSGVTTEASELLDIALANKLKELETNKELFTFKNLSSAKKKGYKIVINGEINTTFTPQKAGTVLVRSPLGTASEKFNMSEIEELTMKDAEKPIEVSEETKEQIKGVVATGSEVVSSDELKSSWDNAKGKSRDDVRNSFLNNLGCK